MLRIRSYAKINLYLDVLRKRRDGYHAIETILQTVSLADESTFELRPHGLSMECTNPGLEIGPDNLMLRAAALLKEQTGCGCGAHIRLDKRIPVAAGLAGGSGDAAAALVGLNRLWDLNLSAPRLHQLAARLGSDVPYCVRGGTVAATGRGEHLAPLTPLPETWFVLLHPAIAVSTRTVYTSPVLRMSPERLFAGRTASFRAAIKNVAEGRTANALFNRMEGVVLQLHPELANWKRRLQEAGCEAALMSGSGPTLYGLCGSQPAAQAVFTRLEGIRANVACSTGHALEIRT